MPTVKRKLDWMSEKYFKILITVVLTLGVLNVTLVLPYKNPLYTSSCSNFGTYWNINSSLFQSS